MKLLDKFIEYPKLPFILSGIIFLSSLVFLSTNKYSAEYTKLQEKAMSVSFLLGKSTDDLTVFARYHVTTKNMTWKDKFNEALAIRNGEIADKKGIKKSLLDRVKEIDFTAEELQHYETAIKLSDNLATREKEAFKLIEEVRSGKTYNYEQDEAKALMLMFGTEYEKYKSEILASIGKFHEAVKKRTDEKIEQLNHIEWSLVTLINVCLLLLVMALKHKEDLEKAAAAKPKRVVRRKKVVRRKTTVN